MGEIVHSVEDCLLALVDLASLSAKQKPLYLFLNELPWIAKSAPEFATVKTTA